MRVTYNFCCYCVFTVEIKLFHYHHCSIETCRLRIKLPENSNGIHICTFRSQKARITIKPFIKKILFIHLLINCSTQSVKYFFGYYSKLHWKVVDINSYIFIHYWNVLIIYLLSLTLIFFYLGNVWNFSELHFKDIIIPKIFGLPITGERAFTMVTKELLQNNLL